MNRNGNAYTLAYALVLAAIVAGVLSWVSTTLAPRQKANADAARDAAIRSAACLPEAAVERIDADGLTVYLCISGEDTVKVLPCSGSGLWGPIWGYIALEPDMSGVRGAAFDHKSETPGLGAEISGAKFGARFAGKPIDKDNIFRTEVDGISGATETSRSLETMVRGCIETYSPYIDSLKAAKGNVDTTEQHTVKTTTEDEGH